MFTGIVEGQGIVVELRLAAGGEGARLELEAPWLVDGLGLGDSVAVNGCCLTVTELTGSGFAADVVAETLRRTALGRLAAGGRVNLEQPVAAGGRLGGHLVQGHVDGLGRVLDRTLVGSGPEGSGEPRGGAPASVEMRFGIDPDLARYVVVKGSIAVDGVSLTVAGVGPDWFSVALVPRTLAVTTLGTRRPGDQVQLEVDVLAKYVERLLEPWTHPQPEQAGGRRA
ncbi:MAG TPA: riboflavin synthase [Actinomycetes bacterium]|nr:riboflavin synthase [Actinomycetes bacterium]